MKWMIFPAILGAVLTPQVSADLAGPAEIPVQKPAQRAPVGPFVIQLQEAISVELPEEIAGISLGSSHIANIAVHDKHRLFISGRAYGVTSLHILDARGNVIADTSIHVVNANETRLTLNRGGHDYTMDCTPNCRPSPDIGDETEFFSVMTEQAGILARDE
jgi:hypothetical protein